MSADYADFRRLWEEESPKKQLSPFMPKDIDQIIGRLGTEIPGAYVTQLQIVHSGADDDGVWFIKIPGRIEEVQVESFDGNCPFLIESDLNSDPVFGRSIDEVVSTIKSLYVP